MEMNNHLQIIDPPVIIWHEVAWTLKPV